MSVSVFALSAAGFWKPRSDSSSVCSPSVSFHCLQATWHARQPMQLAMSISVVLFDPVLAAASLMCVPSVTPDLREAGRPVLTTLTRHALVSCVPAPGSVASIVMWLTLGPVDSPWKPQL